MPTFIDQKRFVLAVGDTVDDLVGSEVTVLGRIDRVVLAETTYRTAIRLRDTPDVVIHIFERESEARRAFGLFRP